MGPSQTEFKQRARNLSEARKKGKNMEKNEPKCKRKENALTQDKEANWSQNLSQKWNRTYRMKAPKVDGHCAPQGCAIQVLGEEHETRKLQTKCEVDWCNATAESKARSTGGQVRDAPGHVVIKLKVFQKPIFCLRLLCSVWSNRLMVLFFTYALVCLRIWACFSRCLLELKIPPHLIPCILLLDSSQRWTSIARSKCQWGRLATGVLCSSGTICSSNIDPSFLRH